MRKRHIVCLTFDFDAISGFIARGQTSPSWISRGEFGPRVGAPRLLALLKKHGIRSTWFIPGHTIETFPQACEKVMAAGHEIAHHGWTHRPPASLTREQEDGELARANESIKRLTGRYARGYRSPSWDLSPHSVELFLKHGFAYGATDELGYAATVHPVSTYDFHATVLHLLGIDHERLTFYHNGIQRRLTNVHGHVVEGLLG